jgi:macrodomain Ter protein organizer (MatP/YcbG family)
MELLSGHGQGNIENPQHKATVQKAMELEDTLEKEVWDLRLGPAIWNRLRESFPEDVLMGNNKELQNYIFMNIFELPAKKFLVFMKEVISGSESGKRLMATMVTSIQEMLRREDYEESMSQFNDDLDDVTDETDEGDIGDFLNNLGISGIRSSDSEEDDDEYLD